MNNPVAIVGWLIGIIGILYAASNRRRSHFPVIAAKVRSHSEAKLDAGQTEAGFKKYLVVDLFCEGINIGGLRVVFEMVYHVAGADRPRTASLQFTPSEGYQEPFTKGQYRNYRLPQTALMSYRCGEGANNELLVPTQLQTGSVSIKFYREGDPKPIHTIPAGEFWEELERAEKPDYAIVRCSTQHGLNTVHDTINIITDGRLRQVTGN